MALQSLFGWSYASCIVIDLDRVFIRLLGSTLASYGVSYLIMYYQLYILASIAQKSSWWCEDIGYIVTR